MALRIRLSNAEVELFRKALTFYATSGQLAEGERETYEDFMSFTKPVLKATFRRQYVTVSGRMFAQFICEDGRSAEIRMRDDRHALMNFTRGEARLHAATHFNGHCDGQGSKCPVTVHRP